MAALQARGMLIAIEGLDGAGTTTQTKYLADWLTAKGKKTETTSEPTSGPVGALIRQAIRGRIKLDPMTLALLFAADRTDHLFNKEVGILKTLYSGAWVITDRYTLSSLSYQVAAHGLPSYWVSNLNVFAFDPDITVFIDTQVDLCLERIAARSEDEEMFHNRNRLINVEERYQMLLNGADHIGHLIRVNGDQPPEDVAKQIAKGIEEYLG